MSICSPTAPSPDSVATFRAVLYALMKRHPPVYPDTTWKNRTSTLLYIPAYQPAQSNVASVVENTCDIDNVDTSCYRLRILNFLELNHFVSLRRY
ncbi:unnamed protein product [Acanthoscelides obtectus]|uniref:Uncharacterized protein n=1 Tax=Acanthoscelides obtectus TaxID=200917 RepID=A0A9P0LEA3_ACAOB|nr:unnamed protein product [Acanthoscelides obtectus]CAK1624396.1 hypothetical protein AOBTE_LOCUS2544 [Acanthoscelides obtectus]